MPFVHLVCFVRLVLLVLLVIMGGLLVLFPVMIGMLRVRPGLRRMHGKHVLMVALRLAMARIGFVVR